MEFWGVEVKPGQTVKYEISESKYLHLSQATLGESKKESKATESATIYLNFDNKKLVIGTLSADKCPQISYDLVFEKDFELSHSWKNGSIYFVGYKVESEGSISFLVTTADDLSDSTDSELEFKDSPVAKALKESKETEPKAKARADAKESEAKKGKEEEEDEDSDEDEDYSEGESDDEDMLNAEDDSSEEDEESSEEDKATPPTLKKGGDKKKRDVEEEASRTPVVEKKAKLVGDEGKKKSASVHQATPYPTKQVSKTPAAAAAGEDKSKKQEQPQTPKSGGPVSCSSCPRTFKDEQALKSHTMAKHPAP